MEKCANSISGKSKHPYHQAASKLALGTVLAEGYSILTYNQSATNQSICITVRGQKKSQICRQNWAKQCREKGYIKLTIKCGLQYCIDQKTELQMNSNRANRLLVPTQGRDNKNNAQTRPRIKRRCAT